MEDTEPEEIDSENEPEAAVQVRACRQNYVTMFLKFAIMNLLFS